MKKINIALISIIALALLIRIYFFIITMNQSLWWDESEYFNIARTFATGISLPTLGMVRPILLSLIISPFYHFFSLWTVENISRGIMVVFSIFSILGAYLCGKRLYNESVGLFTAFFMTVFSLILFLTTKVMTDLPSFTMFIFGIYFFYLYLRESKSKHLYFSSVVFAVGTLFRINILIMFFVLLIVYIIKREIKIKQALISCIIFGAIILPYIIYGYIVYKSFVFTGAAHFVSPSDYLTNFILNVTNYIIILMKYIFIVNISYQISFLIIILLAFLILFTIKDKKNMFIILIIMVPFLSSSFFIGHVEDRYILDSLLGIFLALSAAIIYFYSTIKKLHKTAAIVLLIAIILFIAITQLWSGYSRISEDVNQNSYIKESGFWLRDHLTADEYSMSSNPMQMGYYSNKYSYMIPKNKTDLDVLMREENIKYFVMFDSEKTFAFAISDYNFEYLQKYNLTVVNQTDKYTIYSINNLKTY